ncbi:MAG: hypothetical protein Q8R83_04080 [Legionellaceae bacterium]|nr:hypothetical protein [Legionellaceae bacterium]
MITFKISKFVARYDLEPIYSVDGSEKLHYVVDIYQRENHFFPIVRRRDYFCIYPTKLSELCEEELLIYDTTEEWEMLRSETEEDVLQKVISKIQLLFKEE